MHMKDFHDCKSGNDVERSSPETAELEDSTQTSHSEQIAGQSLLPSPPHIECDPGNNEPQCHIEDNANNDTQRDTIGMNSMQ